MKGSRGRTRAFFGHVCGGGHLGAGPGEGNTLDAFYRQYRTAGFKELLVDGTAGP